MKNSMFFKLFYMVCAGVLMACFFFDKKLGFGLILGAVLSYTSAFLFNKQKERYAKTKKLPIFLGNFFIKYVVIACILYIAMRYSHMLFKGFVVGFVLNQIVLLMEKIRSQNRSDKDSQSSIGPHT